MSVSTVLVRVLVDGAERAGIGRGELLHGLPIDPALLAEVDGRVLLDAFAALQVRVMDLTRDEAFGLHVAERSTEGAFDLMAHLIAHAPTLREAFELCGQFHRLIIDDGQFGLRVGASTAEVRLHLPRTSPRAERMLAEFATAGITRLAVALGGPRAAPRLVSYEHARPPHHREYSRVFGDVVRFDQGATTVVFDSAALHREQLHQHAELFSLLRSHAEQALERAAVGLGIVDRIKKYLLTRSPAKMPDLATAARDLGLSTRSLRRRLTESATSYTSLVQGTLEPYAEHMLRDPARSIQETASALGFTSVSAFHRAFKQWTGMTPATYRKRRAAPEAPGDKSPRSGR